MSAGLPFTVCGVTVRGKQLGTVLGFPTANLPFPEGVALPEDGVYIATAWLGGAQYTAILSQGKHPSAPDRAPTIETHLLDFAGGALYGRLLTVTYHVFLRPEAHFPTMEALKAQIAHDEADARRWAAGRAAAPPAATPPTT